MKSKVSGYAQNVSGKIKKFTRSGGAFRVLPGEVIEIKKIAIEDGRGNVRLPDGLVPMSDNPIVPALDGPPPDTMTMDQVLDIKTSKASGEQVLAKAKQADPSQMEEAVRGMNYNDLRALAKSVGVLNLNRSKEAIVKDVLAKFEEGPKHGLGGAFDSQTITSADIASPEHPNRG